LIVAEPRLEAVLQHARAIGARVVAIDSIQTLVCDDASGRAGSLSTSCSSWRRDPGTSGSCAARRRIVSGRVTSSGDSRSRRRGWFHGTTPTEIVTAVRPHSCGRQRSWQAVRRRTRDIARRRDYARGDLDRARVVRYEVAARRMRHTIACGSEW
jgi:hypothetical protein